MPVREGLLGFLSVLTPDSKGPWRAMSTKTERGRGHGREGGREEEGERRFVSCELRFYSLVESVEALAETQ